MTLALFAKSVRSPQMMCALVSGTAVAACALLSAACSADHGKGSEDVTSAPVTSAPAIAPGAQQEPPAAVVPADAPADASAPCANAGKPAGGACPVSFKSDILASLREAGCANAACHGGASSVSPQILPDASLTWSGFAAFKLSSGQPFVNSCSVDPTESAIATSAPHPVPLRGAGLAPDAIAQIAAWVKCGSPNN
jgi:hypothetical protein